MNNLSCIDLFAGASGLSEGFVRNGFIPIAHVEKDQNACLTIKTRIAYHYLKKQRKLPFYQSYLEGKISREKLYSIIPRYILDSESCGMVDYDCCSLEELFKVISE